MPLYNKFNSVVIKTTKVITIVSKYITISRTEDRETEEDLHNTKFNNTYFSKRRNFLVVLKLKVMTVKITKKRDE